MNSTACETSSGRTSRFTYRPARERVSGANTENGKARFTELVYTTRTFVLQTKIRQNIST